MPSKPISSPSASAGAIRRTALAPRACLVALSRCPRTDRKDSKLKMLVPTSTNKHKPKAKNINAVERPTPANPDHRGSAEKTMCSSTLIPSSAARE